jgi:glutathione synthase/RimK-type ligase-like ATP-grasp enzyme
MNVPTSQEPAPVVTQERQRQRLAAAYQRLRKDPDDVTARLDVARMLFDTPRVDLIRRHVLRAARHPRIDWSNALLLGGFLFKLGEFEGAAQTLGDCLERGQISYAALMTLSAAQFQLDRTASARRNLAAAGWLRPITRPNKLLAGKPNILRLRSLTGSIRGSRKDKRGIYTHLLEGGHFALNNFLGRGGYNLFGADFAGGNLALTDDIPPCHVAINTVSCADLMPGPLAEIDQFLKRYPNLPVINPPRRVLETTRERNYQRLGGLRGVNFPRTLRIVNDGSPTEVRERLEAEHLGYPVILREVGTQTGKTMGLLETPEAVEAHLGETRPGANLYAIEFIDCRSEDGYYHKIRCFFIDQKFYPVACLTNDVWQIHSGDRYRVMSKSQAAQEMEQSYLSDPKNFLGEKAFAALHEIARVIDLDFFGIDFARDDDRGILVFEANAAMRHNFDHARNFPYTEPHLRRVSDAMQRMLAARINSRVTS